LTCSLGEAVEFIWDFCAEGLFDVTEVDGTVDGSDDDGLRIGESDGSKDGDSDTSELGSNVGQFDAFLLRAFEVSDRFEVAWTEGKPDSLMGGFDGSLEGFDVGLSDGTEGSDDGLTLG